MAGPTLGRPGPWKRTAGPGPLKKNAPITAPPARQLSPCTLRRHCVIIASCLNRSLCSTKRRSFCRGDHKAYLDFGEQLCCDHGRQEPKEITFQMQTVEHPAYRRPRWTRPLATVVSRNRKWNWADVLSCDWTVEGKLAQKPACCSDQHDVIWVLVVVLLLRCTTQQQLWRPWPWTAATAVYRNGMAG